MLFGRKNPATWAETIRVWLWPRRSWVRSSKYVAKRILRLTASTHAVSAGVAAGVFASFTPFLGFHFLIAFAVAYIIAGNFLAAMMGTFFGNPLTFPLIWTSTYQLGTFILLGETTSGEGEGLSILAEADLMHIGFAGIYNLITGIWEPLVKPMAIGAVPLGVCFGIVAYMLTRWASIAFRKAQRIRRETKARKLARNNERA